MVSGEKDLLAAAWQQCLDWLEYLCAKAVEVTLEFTLTLRARQVRVPPVRHAAQVERIAEELAVYSVLPDEAQDRSECLLVILGMVMS